MKNWPIAFAFFLAACGGSHSTPDDPPARATRLIYTDPISTGWRLIQDRASSTPDRLVLNLYGPASRGVVFTVAAETGITVQSWSVQGRLDQRGTQVGVFALGADLDPDRPVVQIIVTLAPGQIAHTLDLRLTGARVALTGRTEAVTVTVGHLEAA